LELVLGSGKHWSPQLVPGDVLVFHPLTHHRTFLPENSKTLRISSELRWLKPEGFASTSSPLLPVNLSEDVSSV
jgi:ectoine hydroxylase-related dioxygenase (phytanoyl-CoA dioxygenase family)